MPPADFFTNRRPAALLSLRGKRRLEGYPPRDRPAIIRPTGARRQGKTASPAGPARVPSRAAFSAYGQNRLMKTQWNVSERSLDRMAMRD